MLAIKSELKEIAKEIRRVKPLFKDHQRGVISDYSLHGSLIGNKYEFRHKHIAYCTLRGTPRDKIEKPAPGNEPNESYITKILNELEALRNEQQNVCVGQE